MAARLAVDDFEDELLYLNYLDHDGGERVDVLMDRGDPFEELSDIKFQERFRLSKPTVSYLLQQISEHLTYPTNRNHPVSPMNRLLTTLRFYATGAFNILIGDTANVHKTTVARIIHDVSSIIASYSPRYISFPTSQAQRREVMDGFHDIAQFPGVIGTIDCTHIRIKSPGGEYAETFRNRKAYFSINCQTISDSNLLIRDIVARWPGSVHDSTIFQNCNKRAQFESGEIEYGYLLGDSGYPCKPYLLTPLLNPVTPEEQRYNRAHIKTRNTIERQYGVWKRRFPALSLGLRCEVTKALNIIVATAVLHNIAISTREDNPPDDIEVRRLLEELQQNRGPDIQDDEPVHPVHLMYRDDHNAGRAVRQALINGHFT